MTDRERDAHQTAVSLAGSAAPRSNQPPAPPGGTPPSIEQVTRAPGQPLDAATRAFFEPRLQHDLESVRVHTDEGAARSATAVQALAYTVGPDIAFARDQFAPHTSTGRHLLAHELAHVVQQERAGERRVDRFEARWHQSAERRGLMTTGLSNAEASAVYFGNWMRDLNQVFVPAVLEILPAEVLFSYLSYVAATDFGREMTPEQFGYYLPTEHIDNPAGLVEVDDLLPEQPAVPAYAGPVLPDRLGGVRPPGLVTPQEPVAPGSLAFDGQNAPLFSVDQTGVMAHIRRTNVHVENRLRLAARAGRTPEGFMHLGAGLHAVEDLFAHSNFVEIAVEQLLRERSFLPRYRAPRGSRDTYRDSDGTHRGVFTHSRSVLVGGHPRPILTTGTFTLADTIVSANSELVGLLTRPPPAALTDADIRAQDRFMLVLLRASESRVASNPQLEQQVVRLLGPWLGGLATSGHLSAAYQFYVDNRPLVMPQWVRDRHHELDVATWRYVLMPAAARLQAAAVEARVADTNLLEVHQAALATQHEPLTEFGRRIIQARALATGRPPSDLESELRAAAGRRAIAIAGAPTELVAGPSHSQITRDHPNSPFFGLAFRLAQDAIRQIGDQIVAVWGPTAFHPHAFPPHAPLPATRRDPGYERARSDARALYRANYMDARGRLGGRRFDEETESLRAGVEVVREGGVADQPHSLDDMRRETAEHLEVAAFLIEHSADAPGATHEALTQARALVGGVNDPRAAELSRALDAAARQARIGADSRPIADARATATDLRDIATRMRTARAHRQREALNGELVAARDDALDTLALPGVSRDVALVVLQILDEEIQLTAVAYTSEQRRVLEGRRDQALRPGLRRIALRRSHIDLPANPATSAMHELIATVRRIIAHPYDNTTWWEPIVQDYARHFPVRLANDIEARNEGVIAYRPPRTGRP